MRTLVASVLACLSMFAGSKTLAADWPQWRGPGRDGVWSESGIIEKFATPHIEIRWRKPISSGFSGPTVANGRVYVTDAIRESEHMERVHCFEALTGKEIWTFSYPCDYGPISFRAGPRASALRAQRRRLVLAAVRRAGFRGRREAEARAAALPGLRFGAALRGGARRAAFAFLAAGRAGRAAVGAAAAGA